MFGREIVKYESSKLRLVYCRRRFNLFNWKSWGNDGECLFSWVCYLIC